MRYKFHPTYCNVYNTTTKNNPINFYCGILEDTQSSTKPNYTAYFLYMNTFGVYDIYEKITYMTRDDQELISLKYFKPRECDLISPSEFINHISNLTLENKN